MAANDNQYDRFMFGPGLAVWVYEYANAEVIDHTGVSTGLEAGVQIRGDWTQLGSQGHSGTFGPSSIHCLNSTERFRVQFARKRQSGLQVGFALYPDQTDELGGCLALRFKEQQLQLDRHFYDWARWLASSTDSISDDQQAESRQVILEFIGRQCVEEESDPVLVVKKEIESNYASACYVRHWSDMVGMHAETLARRFKRRFGVTPVRYRTLHRLSQASTMTWSHPDLSIATIGERCGFEDESFFYRTFRAHFGMSPAEWGRRRREPSKRAKQ